MHHHASVTGAELANAAQMSVEAAGESWTAMRAAVFDVIAQLDTPASAYEIADELARLRGRRVAANSIYRILDLFLAADVVRRVESANAYVVNPHPGCLHDCIFLVCDQCRKAVHIDDDNLAHTVRAAAAGAGFNSLRPVIEVRGRCADCQ